MIQQTASIAFHDLQPELDDFLQDVVTGLGKTQKEIPAKYFYDERGSILFDEICDLEEYYPTRSEISILQAHRREIAALFGENCVVVEYGSGSSRKIPILLSALRRPAAYMPIDICKEYLLQSSRQISVNQPDLDVIAICADYTQMAQLPQSSQYKDAKRVIFFPGSTIGNYTPTKAIRLLKSAVNLVGPGGGMLIGVDLKKDTDILHAAYNDARGITAEFNLNMLSRINRELNTDFDLNAFRHHAFYNEAQDRIEMHLLSLKDQSVTGKCCAFRFREGETIHTESSYKYSLNEFQNMAEVAGFETTRVWTDDKRLFSLHYLSVH